MKAFPLWLRLLIVGLIGLIVLAYSDKIPDDHWWGEPLSLLLHHAGALIAGAVTVGLLFEFIARDEWVVHLKKTFLDDSQIAGMFSETQRERWVGIVLDAQLASVPSLSQAIFKEVVQPFMTQRKRRSRYHYTIELKEPPAGGWQFEGITIPQKDFVWLNVVIDVVQHLPPLQQDTRDEPKRDEFINVQLILSTAVEDLQKSFDDEQCVFREHLMIGTLDAELWRTFARKVANGQKPDVLGMSASLVRSHDSLPADPVKIEVEAGRIVFWFHRPKGPDANIAVKVTGPYPRRQKYFEVVFGEPVANPWITFKADPAIAPLDEIQTIDFVQGLRKPGPTVQRERGAVEVTFPPREAEQERWVLPRSGVIFLWP
jgi:hypothetical protein